MLSPLQQSIEVAIVRAVDEAEKKYALWQAHAALLGKGLSAPWKAALGSTPALLALHNLNVRRKLRRSH